MTLPNDKLELARLLHRELKQTRVVDDRNISGIVPLALDFDLIKNALETLEMLVSDRLETRALEFSLPPTYHLSIESLLLGVGRRVMPQDRFYVADIDFIYPTEIEKAVPITIQAYLDATSLFQTLRSSADHINQIGSSISLVFLSQKKIEITPNYTASDLQLLPKIDEFACEFIKTNTHKLQKEAILKTVLFELFPEHGKISLSRVIEKFPQLVDNCQSSYQLYVCEFSFLKVKSEIEKEKIEFTSKLNKVFSDIQNQILAAPAALVLVGGQMENSSCWSIKNLLIWTGALIFSIFMNMLINNQRHTLKSVKKEVDHQRKLIEDKHRSVAAQFRDNYDQLDKRYTHQKKLLLSVELIVSASLALATSMLIWYSVPDAIPFAITISLIALACFLAGYILIKRFSRYKISKIRL